MPASGPPSDMPLKIHKTAFTAGIWSMLAMAVLLSSARSYIRLRKFKRLFADDGFLFLAVIALIAGTIILYADVPAIYTINDVLAGVEKAPIDFSDQLIQDHGFQVAASSLEMLAVFSVKFSFLFFFRSLIRRIPYLTIWWWCILACLVPTALICIFSGFLGCRDFGAQALITCSTPEAIDMIAKTSEASAVLDALTDIMLISIPVILLWRVQIQIRKKICLGLVLSLSVFMIVVNIIRGAGIDYGNANTTWVIFWTQIEASVAVIMASLTAFRSLFIADGTKSPKRLKEEDRLIFHEPKEVWDRKYVTCGPLSVPSASFSGVRGVIGQGQRFGRQAMVGEDKLPSTRGTEIRVTYDISMRHLDLQEQNKHSSESFV